MDTTMLTPLDEPKPCANLTTDIGQQTAEIARLEMTLEIQKLRAEVASLRCALYGLENIINAAPSNVK